MCSPENIRPIIIEQSLDLWRLQVLYEVVDWDVAGVRFQLTPVVPESTRSSPHGEFGSTKSDGLANWMTNALCARPPGCEEVVMSC